MNWTRWQLEEWQRRQMKLPEPPPLTGNCIKEAALHTEIMAWCETQWPRVMYIHARMDKRPTIGVGICDFVLFLPESRVLCIECKAKGRKRTPEQVAWAFQMQRLGHEVHLVRNWAEFQQLVT